MKVKRQIIWVGVVIVALVALLVAIVYEDGKPVDARQVTATILGYETNDKIRFVVVQVKNDSSRLIRHRGFLGASPTEEFEMANAGNTQGTRAQSLGEAAVRYLMQPTLVTNIPPGKRGHDEAARVEWRPGGKPWD